MSWRNQHSPVELYLTALGMMSGMTENVVKADAKLILLFCQSNELPKFSTPSSAVGITVTSLLCRTIRQIEQA